MKVKLLSPVKHDGDFYEPGDVIDVSEKSATRLFRIKAAEKATDADGVVAPIGSFIGVFPPAPAHGDDQQLEKPIDRMSKEELQAELTAMGVPITSALTVLQLRSLLKQEKAK